MSRREDFWSRRKAGVAAEAEADRAARDAAAEEQTRRHLEERSDAEVLAELKLPDPDTLQQGDDFSAFLQKAVPERLRRRALRRLWLSNPALANLDELVDYGEDFTDAANVIENLQTTYQVGKGMLKHVLAQEEAAAKMAALDEGGAAQEDTSDPEQGVDEPAPDAPAETAVAQVDPESSAAEEATIAEAQSAGTSSPTEDPEPATPIRRRMRFDVAT